MHNKIKYNITVWDKYGDIIKEPTLKDVDEAVSRTVIFRTTQHRFISLDQNELPIMEVVIGNQTSNLVVVAICKAMLEQVHNPA